MGSYAALSLVFFGLLAYFNAIRHPFVHDDVVFILKNPHIADISHWYQAFFMPAAGDGINTYYRPILEILYRLEYFLFGFNPAGFHFFNVLVHITNGLLIFSLLKRLKVAEHLAWICALFFLIHPVQTEAVSCVAGISNLWMALFVLLALNAYLKEWYAASLLCFILAFFSKEQALMLVPLVMVIDYARGRKPLGAWLMWILSALGLLWLRQEITGASLSHAITSSQGELYLRLAAIPRVLGMDLRLIFFPYDLHYYRSTDILQSNTFSWIAAIVALCALVFIYKRWTEGQFILILGLGWFMATLLPVLNIAPLINEYSFILTGEHFLYLPIVGILMIVVFLFDSLPLRLREWVLGIMIASCFMLTWYQNTFWRSEIALFERMLRYEPNFGRGHLLLAKAYYFNGKPQLAEDHFRKSYIIMTGYEGKASNETARNFYLKFTNEILFDWAQNESSMGLWKDALEKLKQAAVTDQRNPAVYNNLAFVYLHLGDRPNAVFNLKQALKVDPSFDQAKRNLQQLSLQN